MGVAADLLGGVIRSAVLLTLAETPAFYRLEKVPWAMGFPPVSIWTTHLHFREQKEVIAGRGTAGPYGSNTPTLRSHVNLHRESERQLM